MVPVEKVEKIENLMLISRKEPYCLKMVVIEGTEPVLNYYDF